MAQADALAKVYARSLYELAEEAGGPEKVFEIGDELEQIREVARGEAAFAEFIGSPIIDHGRRAEALRRIFQDQVTDLTLRFMLVLNQKGRLGHFEPIVAAYDQLVQAAHGRIEVDVYTPTSLDDDERRTLSERIQQAIGRDPVLHAYTDPTMLGGLRLRIGDQLIDGSVSTRIRRIRQNLLAGGAARIRAESDRIIEEGSA